MSNQINTYINIHFSSAQNYDSAYDLVSGLEILHRKDNNVWFVNSKDSFPEWEFSGKRETMMEFISSHKARKTLTLLASAVDIME